MGTGPRHFKVRLDLDSEDMISKAPVVICLLLAVPFLADGLQCYQCNSNTAQQSDCMDPFVKEGSQEVKDSLKKYLQECPQIDGEAATLCRKVDQYVRGEASVIRTLQPRSTRTTATRPSWKSTTP